SFVARLVLQDDTKAEERLAILNARANQLDERLARRAKERAATIDSLLQVALACVTAIVTAMARLKNFTKRSLTDLTDRTQRAFAYTKIRVQNREQQPNQGGISRRWTQLSTTVFQTGTSMLAL